MRGIVVPMACRGFKDSPESRKRIKKLVIEMIEMVFTHEDFASITACEQGFSVKIVVEEMPEPEQWEEELEEVGGP